MGVLLTTSQHARLITAEVGTVTLVDEFDGALEAVLEFDGEAEPSVEFEGEVNGVAAKNLEIAKGENKTFGFTHKKKDGTIIALTSATVFFAVRTSANAASAIIEKDSGTPAEITIDDAPNGHANIFLVPDDTNAQDAEDYVYDVWVVDASAKRNQAIEAARFRIRDRVVVIP